MKKLLVVVLTLLFGAAFANAQDKRGTPAQAEAMVKKAIEFIKANGKEKAFEAFNDAKGKFVDGDLYVMVYDLTGKCVAHGANPKMIGKDLIDMKDADGKLFVKERVEMATAKGKGWQNYKWTNPTNKNIEAKTAYIQKLDDVIVCSGAYKK
jgi:signal transduction histidine kinase